MSGQGNLAQVLAYLFRHGIPLLAPCHIAIHVEQFRNGVYADVQTADTNENIESNISP